MTGEKDELQGAFPLLQTLRPFLQNWRWPVYLVGGAVRDALLGHTSYDLDFVVPHEANRLAFAVADHLGVAAYTLDEERDIGRVVFPERTMLDFARYRGPDLQADLEARDFTINAMAVPAAEPRLATLIDPTQGRRDLEAGVIRLVYGEAIEDDPLRALRAVRLSGQLQFPLTLETAAAVQAAAVKLKQSSPERIRDELLKLLEGRAPQEAVRQMAELGLLDVVLPEVAALRQVPGHAALEGTLGVLRWLVLLLEALLLLEPTRQSGREPVLPALEEVRALLQPYKVALQGHLQRTAAGGLQGHTLLRLGALFHEVGKAGVPAEESNGRRRFPGHEEGGAELTARRLRQLRLSKQVIGHVSTIVGAQNLPWQLLPAGRLTRRAVYHYYQATGRAGLDVAFLALAQHLAAREGPGDQQEWKRLRATVASLYEHYFRKHEETIAPPPLLGGDELMAALDLEAGPQIGRLLRAIEEGQAAGEVTDRAEALSLARRLLRDEG